MIKLLKYQAASVFGVSAGATVELEALPGVVWTADSQGHLVCEVELDDAVRELISTGFAQPQGDI